MEKKILKNCFILNKFNYFCLLLLLSFTNCVIEIPFNIVNVKGIPKYKNIKILEPNEYPNNSNNTILANEGNGIINRNILFLATVKIGSDNQQFNLILDTGSYIAWVPKVGSADSHTIQRHFNPSTSTTSTNTQKTFQQKYGTGYCSGYYYKDYFKYINDKSFSIQFGVADKTELGVDNGDGIIGLAHYYPDETISFIHMLKKAKITDSISFSFKFDFEKKNGKLYIGKHDDFSSAVTCPLLTYTDMYNIYWACQVSGFGLKSTNYEKSSSRTYTNIIFDTGTNILLLPLDYLMDLDSYLSKFGCQKNKNEDNGYQIVCTTYDLPNFTFNINGNTFMIPYYYLFYKSSSYYVSNVVFEKSDLYIIGSPFFLSFHTFFDKENEKLHFYPMKSEFLNTHINVISIIAVVIIIILIVAGLTYLCYKYIKWKRAKRELDQNFPSSNYNANFI